MPGVLAVLTGADFLADGLKPIPHKPWSPHPAETTLSNKSGEPPFEAPHYPLPADKARFVGEAVAMVVAETVYAAKDGAEAIDDRLRGAAGGGRDRRRGAAGRAASCTRASAPTSASMPSSATPRRPTPPSPAPRMSRASKPGCSASPACQWSRARALADFDAATGRFTVYAGNGGAVRLKHDLATMLGVPPEQVRVLMQDVGGNFGTRGMIYPEFALVAWAARKLGRPVKWIIERTSRS